MDPAGIKLTTDDTSAREFPVPFAFAGKRTPMDATGRDPGEMPETAEGDPDSPDYLMGDWWSPKPSRPLHATRCTSIARSTGQRCRSWSVVGFEKCVKHSGYEKFAHLPEYRERVLERARLDLLRMGPYAVEALGELVRDRDINPAVRLKAGTEVLDRIGVKGGTDVNVTVVAEGQSPAEIIRGRLDRLAAAATAAIDPPPASETEIFDAEEVPDDDDAA
jgi:hypothetical protein